MKRYLLIYVLIAAVLSSCSKENGGIIEPIPGLKPVTFEVAGVDTRAAETNTSTISEFGVFCFNTVLQKWENVKTTALPEKMFNQAVERNGENWEYNPPVYWEGITSGYHTFFGYSPYAQGTYDPVYNRNGNNITVKQQTNAEGTEAPLQGAPKLDFEVMPQVGEQTDLLYAKPNYDLSSLTPLVKMHFQHALTCVGFRAFSGIAGTSVDSIRIAGIHCKGTLNLETGAWEIDPTEKGTYVYDQPTFVTTDGSEPTQISAPNGYFMLLPQNFKTTNTDNVKIEFFYTQNGTALQKDYTLKEDWAMGKRTIYTINLGGTPSQDLNITEIEVTDWQFTDGGEMQTGDLFTLTLDPNEGSLGIITSTEKRLAASYDPLTIDIPSRTDWIFTWWNESKDGTGARYAAGEKFRMPKKDVTLYAQWGKVYTLTYDKNNGDALLMPPAEQRVSTTTDALKMPQSYNPDVAPPVGDAAYGHLIFKEWNTQADGQGDAYPISKSFTMPEHDVTLYAQWNEEKYMLIYMMNDNPDVAPDEGEAWNITEEIKYNTTSTLASDFPKREGYTFKEWNTEPGGTGTTYQPNGTIQVKDNIVLYAQWTKDQTP